MSNRVSIRALAVPGTAFMTQPAEDGAVLVPSLLGDGVTDGSSMQAVNKVAGRELVRFVYAGDL